MRYLITGGSGYIGGRLTEQLLNQALIIHRSDAAVRARVDLREIATRVAPETDHDLMSTGENLRLDLPEEPVFVEADALSLVEATKNLVNNAFRYGEPPVLLTVDAADAAVISVVDHGSGIPEADWPDSGGRFARSAGSAPSLPGSA